MYTFLILSKCLAGLSWEISWPLHCSISSLLWIFFLFLLCSPDPYELHLHRPVIEIYCLMHGTTSYCLFSVCSSCLIGQPVFYPKFYRFIYPQTIISFPDRMFIIHALCGSCSLHFDNSCKTWVKHITWISLVHMVINLFQEPSWGF